MKPVIYICLIVCTVLPVAAQNQQRMQAEFRRLENYIERIEEQVRRFNDRQAQEHINRARQYLEAARSDLNQKPQPRYGSASLNMRQAKNFADLAARRIIEQPVGNLKLQLDDMIQEEEPAVVQSGNQEALYLLNQAKRFRTLAYQSFQNNQPLTAQEYYRIAYFFARKSGDLALNRGRDIDSRLSELETTIQNLFTQSESFLAGSETEANKRLLDEAYNYYQEALQLIEEGRKDQALRRLILIERLLYRIYDQAERSDVGIESKLAFRLYSQQTLLQSLESEPEQNNKPVLDKARQLYDEAQRDYEQKDYRQAEQKLALSQRLANTVFRNLGDKQSLVDDALPMRLKDARQLLNMQNASGDQKFSRLYQEAQALLDRAEAALANGNQSLAFQLIQAATRMSYRLQRESQQPSTVPEKEQLEKKYLRLTEAIHQYQNNQNLYERYGTIIDQWQYFADQGKKYLDEDNLVLADEYFNTGLEQIKSYSIKWYESSKKP